MGRCGIVLLAGTALVSSGCDAFAEASPATFPPGVVVANATIAAVVDGDTVDVDLDGREERVRLIGIDTPETKKRDSPIECFGPEASAFTEQLLPVGTPVRIERDTVGRDDYGRLLGYVYRADDGIFVNYEIVRQGFAQPLSIEPNTTYEGLFVDAARSAESSDTGLWGTC